MKRIRCSVSFGNQTTYVAAYLAAPGLAVHRSTLEGKLLPESFGWTITHILSGRTAIPSNMATFKTRREAVRFARCLSEFLDFTVGGRTLDVQLNFREHIVPVIERFKAGHDPGN